MGEQQREVYVFKEDSSREVRVNKVNTSDVWHRRLGHPSKLYLYFLEKIGFI